MRLTIACLSLSVVSLFAQSQPSTPPTRSIKDGVYTMNQADRGKALYTSYCAECHMSDLQGKQPPPVGGGADPLGNRFPRYIPGSAPALASDEFRSNWVGLRLGDLYTRIRVSMPQRAPGSLSRQQTVDITAYLLNANAYPAGADELPTNQSPLDDIRIEP